MDHASGLTAESQRDGAPLYVDCPDCRAPSANLTQARSVSLDGVPLRRCFRCGHRSTWEETPRRVLACSDCGLPFLAGPLALERCPACAAETRAPEQPDEELVQAAEAEVRAALAARWRFVGSRRVSDYLGRVLRGVASAIDGAPASGHVLLVDEPAWHTLALPSGTVILSVAFLAALEDEAELAFVLGHELAHVAAGDSAAALVRFGLHEVETESSGAVEAAWARAAVDLVRLGFGDLSEYRADATSAAALAAVGYDLESARRLFERLGSRTDAGRVEIADLALAHPPPWHRLRRLAGWAGPPRPAAGILRIDREVFRRAAGPSVLAAELVPQQPFDAPQPAATSPGGARRGRLILALASLAAAAVLLALWGIL